MADVSSVSVCGLSAQPLSLSPSALGKQTLPLSPAFPTPLSWRKSRDLRMVRIFFFAHTLKLSYILAHICFKQLI